MFLKGNKPPNFKEVGVGYYSLHRWIANHKPKSMFCECCGKITNKLDASSINHSYARDISKWEWLCRPCHFNKDKILKEFRLICIQGHEVIGNNLWINNRGDRVCLKCKRIYAKREYGKHKEKYIERVNRRRIKIRTNKK